MIFVLFMELFSMFFSDFEGYCKPGRRYHIDDICTLCICLRGTQNMRCNKYFKRCNYKGSKRGSTKESIIKLKVGNVNNTSSVQNKSYLNFQNYNGWSHTKNYFYILASFSPYFLRILLISLQSHFQILN